MYGFFPENAGEKLPPAREFTVAGIRTIITAEKARKDKPMTLRQRRATVCQHLEAAVRSQRESYNAGTPCELKLTGSKQSEAWLRWLRTCQLR